MSLHTELIQHIGDVLSIDGSIAVPVQYLEPLTQRPYLRGLQL